VPDTRVTHNQFDPCPICGAEITDIHMSERKPYWVTPCGHRVRPRIEDDWAGGRTITLEADEQ